jgi:hypothetical protein
MALKFIENNSERNEADEEYVYKTTISKAKEYDMSSVAEDIIFKIPATILFLKVGQKNVVLDITLSDFTLRHVENGISRYKEYGYQKKYTFFAYIKNEIYLQHNGRVRPAVLNDLVCAQKGCREVREIIKKWIEHEIPNNQFYKDFLTLFLESCDYGYALMPVTLIDIAKNHNWNEYFNNKYKTAGSLGVNFNRYKPYVSYVFIKCSKYIEFSKRQLFLQTLNEHPEFTKLCKKDREKVKEVIKNYYTHRLRLSEEKDKDEYLILNDWISMCMRLKIPIPLKKNSIKKIHELHDEITQENWVMEHAKEKDQIIVKEDSVFNELRQILPISFEWIKTRKRLFMESSMQHHCVWSYEEYIVDDKSAIYSYVCAETGCRHTIEFIYNENKYIVSQIQKNYDKGCDIQVIETLRKYLGAEAVQDI